MGSKHRYLGRVRQVEHHEDRALSVLSEGIERLGLKAVGDPTVYLCSWAAGDDLAGGVSVENSFDQHPHSKLPK
jgi:hypothetical protein